MKILLVAIAMLMSIDLLAQAVLKTDSVYVSGYVKNFTKNKSSANSVTIVVDDLALGDQLIYKSQIDDDGTYRLVFPKTGTQDVRMEYIDKQQQIIVSPGAHMQIDFDADRFESSSTFKGDNAQANIDLKAYFTARRKQWKLLYGNPESARYKSMGISEKNNGPEAHKKFLTERYLKEKKLLTHYIKLHNYNTLFVKWVMADLKYEYLENLMRYRWLHVIANDQKTDSIDIPDSYFDFAKSDTWNAVDQSLSRNFQGYIREYAKYYDEKQTLELNSFDDVMKFYNARPPSLLKDFILCHRFYAYIKRKLLHLITPHIAELESNITQAEFKESILTAYNDAVYKENNYTVPLQANINEVPLFKADDTLNNIIAKYRGSVIYVDFWGTWCVPCMKEMPDSKKLYQQFGDKKVIFLYLGVRSEVKIWKALIAELKIQGEHYLISNNDYKTISEKFQISGIPRYLLFDKSGKLIYDNAKRPSDKELIKDIETLLAAK